MKTIKLIAIGAFMTAFTMGCALTQKLPSVTVGGAANHKSLLGATASKEAITVTAPLVDINVPLPTLKGNEE
jgi:hypothetical protein